MKKIDLTKILKVGDRVYSIILGDGVVKSIEPTSKYPIYVKFEGYEVPPPSAYFTKDGFYHKDVGECVLFPSKEERDWGKYMSIKHIERRYDFKPYERVLCRDTVDEPWTACLYSHQHNDDDEMTVTVGGYCYRLCIPYEGNEHLLGTNKSE